MTVQNPQIFAQSLFSVYCIVDRCLSLCPFSLGHYIVCPSTIKRLLITQKYLHYPLAFLESLSALYYYPDYSIYGQW